jgi:branched-chain amino acid transport system substrate-binding protein
MRGHRRTTRRSLIVVAALAAAALVAACGTAGGAAGGAQNGVTDTSLTIGAWMPLSGTIAPHGQAQRAGYEAALSLVPGGQVNGRKIDFTVQDNAFDAAQSVAIARRLVEQDKVFAIVGANGTGQTKATFDYVIAQNKVPILLGYGGDIDWYAPPNPSIFGALMPYQYQSDVLSTWIKEDGLEKAAVVHFTAAAGQNAATEFAKAFGATGGSADLYPYNIGNTDWTPMVRSIVDKGYDAVVLDTDVSAAVGFLQEAARQGLRLPTYGWGSLSDNEIIQLLGQGAEGFKAASQSLVPNSPTPEVQAYRDALRAVAPDVKPGGESMVTYASMQIFLEALKRIDGAPTREKLLAALQTIKDFRTGILPPVGFDATHHLATSCMYRTEVKGGEFVQLAEQPTCAESAADVALPPGGTS